MVMEMRLRWINWTHRAYLLQRDNRREMDGKGIHLKGKCDSYPHIVYGFVSYPLSYYTDISAHPKAHSATVTKKQDHAAPPVAPLSVVVEVEGTIFF